MIFTPSFSFFNFSFNKFLNEKILKKSQEKLKIFKHRVTSMNDVKSVVEKLLKAKEEKGLTFEEIGKKIGRDAVWVAALLYRQATASQEEAEKLKEMLGLDEETAKELTKPPYRGNLLEDVPRDPVIYRFYEILQVYGLPLKAVIHEMFGDGIMSAIDFSVTVSRKEDPKGDRVVITFEGKFLPYKKW